MVTARRCALQTPHSTDPTLGSKLGRTSYQDLVLWLRLALYPHSGGPGLLALFALGLVGAVVALAAAAPFLGFVWIMMTKLKQGGVRLLRKPKRLWGIFLPALLICRDSAFYIVLGSFQYDSWEPRYVPGAELGSLIVFYWHRVLLSCMSTSIFWELFLHTLLIDSPGLWLGRIFLSKTFSTLSSLLHTFFQLGCWV